MSRECCPNCDRPLPGTALSCFHCGWSIPVAAALRNENDVLSGHAGGPGEMTSVSENEQMPVGSHALSSVRRTKPIYSGPSRARNNFDEPPLQLTWQKVVETPHRPLGNYPPRPPRPLQSHPALRYIPYGWHIRPTIFFWLCMGLLVLVAGVGSIGMAANHVSLPGDGGPSLSVTPRMVASGTTMSLQGSGFTADGQIGLSRDSSIPIVDSEDSSVTMSDGQGDLSDTAMVGSEWGSGPHTINAEDAETHKTTSFPVQVTGDVGPVQPAHLLLGTDSLDLGTGDQATNSLQSLTLQNDGGGQIDWTGTTTQPWLMISPRSGVLTGGIPARIAVAVNRYNLTPGDYTAQVLFSSNVGDDVLTVHMHVTPLLLANTGVLQLTPAVLTYTAVDGGSLPDPQVVTVSNPGSSALRWTAHSSVPWLNVSKQTAVIAPNQSSAVQVMAQTTTLLPGTYNGLLTFTADGSTLHSPQSIYVSVTITPHCSLLAAPNVLSFTGSVGQMALKPKTITLGTSSSCTSPMKWSAQSNASWLKISSMTGKTPSSLSVQVNPGGLTAGVYTSSIAFTTSMGTQIVLVSFTLGNGNVPALSVNMGALNFQGIAGDTDSPVQTVQLTNTGAGMLFWHVNAVTDLGGNWLLLDKSSGSLGPGQSTRISASVRLTTLLANTYTGVINVDARDSAGNVVAGTPLQIPVNLAVSQPCALQNAPHVLTFLGYTNQSAPAAQSVSFVSNSSCKHPLIWSASATSTTGGPWLHTLLTSGTLTSKQVGTLPVGVQLTDLAQGAYHGIVSISAMDSVTKKPVGNALTIDVTLNVQPPCTLQLPTAPNLSFSAEAGSGPQTRTLQVSVVGTCKHVVNVLPTAVNASGRTWLSITPSAVSVAANQQATFTVVATPGNAGTGSYSGSIALTALDGGIAIVGSSQSLAASLQLVSPPVLAVNQTAGLTFNTASAGQTAQTITINNTGGSALNWKANLNVGTPAFVSLSAQNGTIVGGSAAPLSVNVNAAGVAAGTYNGSVVISASDATTGAALGGTVTVPLTITIAAAPQLRVNASTFNFAATVDANPAGQILTITNAGGGTLHWSINTPSSSWLAVSQASGSDGAGLSSQITLSVNTVGLAAGGQTYPASIVVTPSTGASMTINVGLTVNNPPGATGGSPNDTSPVPTSGETPTAIITPG